MSNMFHCYITLFFNCQQGSPKNRCQEKLPARIKIVSKNKHFQIKKYNLSSNMIKQAAFKICLISLFYQC